MSDSFWVTMFGPTIHGNPWALAALAGSQALLCWRFYQHKNVGMTIFSAVIASANLTRLIEACPR